MLTLERLKAVRRLLLDHGWIKGKMSTEDGHCLVGAVRDSSRRSKTIQLHLCAVIVEFGIGRHGAGGNTPDYLMSWNDQPQRRFSEVIALLDRLIEKLETRRMLRGIERQAHQAARTGLERAPTVRETREVNCG